MINEVGSIGFLEKKNSNAAFISLLLTQTQKELRMLAKFSVLN